MRVCILDVIIFDADAAAAVSVVVVIVVVVAAVWIAAIVIRSLEFPLKCKTTQKEMCATSEIPWNTKFWSTFLELNSPYVQLNYVYEAASEIWNHE